MASHQLAIAKASFSASLLRPDPTSVPRDDITAFHSALDKALSHCSSTNIQTCKSWLLNYVVSSSNRVGVCAKYLVALSGSFTPQDNGNPAKGSAKRRRLHILYLLNDLFHHTKYHLDSMAAFSTLSGSCQPCIVELLGYAASYDRENHPKHHRRLDDLLDIWAEHGYYGTDYVNKLREVVKNAALSGPVTASIGVEESNTTAASQKLTGKDVPFNMPSTHGDPSTPYYDLPAGNLVPHIIPNSTVPLRPESIKPLQFLAGPADEKLVTALKVFMNEVDRIYESGKPEPKGDDQMVDIDELGQPVMRDTTTGEIINGETYYGWSRTFCEQMKKRSTKDADRSRSGSWSRYSDSPHSDDSRARSRSRREGPTRRSYSRSCSPPRRQSPLRERSYSPPGPPVPRSFPPPHQPKPFASDAAAAPPPAPPGLPFPPPPPMNPQHFPPPHMYNPGMIPGSAPPPPPPNYQGPWPPPPPMPGMPGMMNPSFPPGAGPGSGPGPAHSGSMPGASPPAAFPSSFPLQGSGHFPPVHMGGAQQLPPGSYRFPPPHSGSGPGPGSGYPGWGQSQGGGRGRGWR